MKKFFLVLMAAGTTAAFAETLTYNCADQAQHASISLTVSYPEHRPLSLSYSHEGTAYHGGEEMMSVIMGDYNISLSMPIEGGTLKVEFPKTEIKNGVLRARDSLCDSFPSHDRFGQPRLPPAFCSDNRPVFVYAGIFPNEEMPSEQIIGMDGIECTLTLE